jgi:hypothetical protein
MFSVRNAQKAHKLTDGAQILGGFLGRANLGQRHDLDQRHAGPVVVDERGPSAREVQVLAGVFLDVDAQQADPAGARCLGQTRRGRFRRSVCRTG